MCSATSTPADARNYVLEVELHLITGRVREPNERFFRNDARSTSSDVDPHGTFTDREGWIVSLADDLCNSRGLYLRRCAKQVINLRFKSCHVGGSSGRRLLKRRCVRLNVLLDGVFGDAQLARNAFDGLVIPDATDPDGFPNIQ